MLVFGFGAVLTAGIGIFIAFIIESIAGCSMVYQRGITVGWIVVLVIAGILGGINQIIGFFWIFGMFWAYIILKG